MRGPFGGELEAGEAVARANAPAAIVEALTADAPAPIPGLVPARGVGGAVELAGDLRGLAPLDAPGSRRDLGRALGSIARALELLEKLHAAGRAHGDLRPDHVFAGERIALVYPARAVEGDALLRARLGHGAAPREVDFVAPELLAGSKAVAASDVFSAAALVHWAVHARPPHGKASFLSTTPGIAGALDGLVQRSLEPDPAKRPSLAELRAAVATAAKSVEVAAEEGEEAVDAAAKRTDSPLILGCILVLGGILTLAGALWLVVSTWDWVGEVGHLAFLLLLTGAAGGGGALLEKRGYSRSGFALVALATQLLWADVGWILSMSRQADEPGPWAFASALITAVTYGLAIRRRSVLLSILGAASASIAVVTLGVSMKSGSTIGASVWCAICALALGGLAYLGRRLTSDRVGFAPALASAGFLLVSASIAFGVEHDAFAYWLLWPYACAAIGVGLGFALLRVDATAPRALAFTVGAILLAIVPTAHTLSSSDHHHVLLYGATVLGTALVVLAFKQPAIAASSGLRLVTILVGLVSVCAAPGLKAIEQLVDRDGDTLAREVIGVTDPNELLVHPLFHLPYALGTAVVLVGLGLLFARDAEEKWPYRLIECVGLVLFFFTLTVLSVADWRGFLYPAVLFGGGLGALAVGAQRRHMMLVVVPASALVLDTWIQYFAKLKLVDFPLGLALIGFGVGVLVGGVLFERKVRPFLPALKSWA